MNKWKSTKLWVTIGSLLSFDALLYVGKILPDNYVSLYMTVVGLFFGANVWATREHENSKTSVIKAKGEQNGES